MKRLIIIPFLFSLFNGLAQVKLPRLIRDSMILQRDEKIKLWGWASVNERVQVRFNGKVYKTKADADGNWMVHLPPTKAGGPYSMDIIAGNKITLHEILFGDVWFCSGQSNMVHQMNIHDVTYERDIAEANYPQIRQFWIPTLTSFSGPQTDLPSGYWKSAVGEEVRPFSAVAYFFAKKIYEKYKVPVGIINASVGGTPIEAWISEDGLKDFPALIATKDTFNRKPLLPALPADAGMVNTPKWYDPALMLKGWRNIHIPGYWEDQGIKDLNGVVWYRREMQIPASMAGKPAKVFLGRIVDADELYINGKKVGSTGYQYPQRRYQVPADVLKAGKNVFVVRVTNNSGKGGFVPDKPYCIFSGADTVDLKGDWQYKVGAVYRPFTGAPVLISQNQPTTLYNAMVAPEINYAIKGFCWYQGESNTAQPKQYQKLLPALINDWRIKWNQGSLPFLYVQLPGFMEYNYLPSESNLAILRESQLKSLSVPNTAMAVTIDLGEWNDIHPDDKKDVGERLALTAMKVAYKENITYTGPLYQSSVIEGNKIIISFTNTGGGLITIDGDIPSAFAIAGADKKFVWANAQIEGDKIIVWSDEIAEPLYVRYAWADNPVNPNLFNKERLPASPFRTDE
ncbi:sialate O-acetylesterase [Chitinophaga sp. YR573]|uniref:sialate O-acetylesterase n=1 Tax=Chitinophaga sp. YR573 TaxID=1881040 RepID=UPI0008BFBE16|nr:sialate O-acetylesterase [Chitinophaga sp. YR573]SEW39098.1 sialate O-acetylesterase [Chitinophaga sp. YR573]